MAEILPSRSTEFRRKYANGAWIWILLFGKVAKWDEDGKPPGFIGTGTEITERKHTGNVWRASEERYRPPFEHSREANILSNRESDFQVVNSKARRIFSYPQEQWLKTRRSDFVDETSGQFKQLIKALYRDKKDHGKVILQRKSGEHFIREVCSTVLQISYRQFRHKGSIRNITTEAALQGDAAQIEARYALNPANFASEKELASFPRNKAVELTGRVLGSLYLVLGAFIHLEKFSRSSHVGSLCTASDPKHDPFKRAGIWADSSRLRRPVMHN